MALRKQASQQFGTPDELSSILVEKIRKGEVKNALVVGLPYSGKHEFATSLRDKIEKRFVAVLFDAIENPGDMYQNVAMCMKLLFCKHNNNVIQIAICLSRQT